MPFSLTEEFVAVYRMHPLIPDSFDFRAAADDSPTIGPREFDAAHRTSPEPTCCATRTSATCSTRSGR